MYSREGEIMKKKNGFTLVELLAVIVILAIILVIAVPKITDTIKNSKIASFESSAKTIAAQAEKKKMEKQKNFQQVIFYITGLV